MLIRRFACSLALGLITGTALLGCRDDGDERADACRDALRVASEPADGAGAGSGEDPDTAGEQPCSAPAPPAGPDADGVCDVLEAGTGDLAEVDGGDPDDLRRAADVFDQAADRASGELRRDLLTLRDLGRHGAGDELPPDRKVPQGHEAPTARLLRWMAEHC